MKKILLISVLCLLHFSSYCNNDNHVIVSIDLKTDIVKYETKHIINEMTICISQMLTEQGINSGYASIQGFSVSENAKNLDEYIKPFCTFAEFSSNDNILNSFDATKLAEMRNQGGNNTDGYSLLTISRPYSILRFMDLKDTPLVNKTYLFLVTDNHYNGNDNYGKEIEEASPTGIKRIKKEIMQNMINVQQNYFYNLIAEKNISKNNREGYISLFEVIPIQQYFSIESVLDFPHIITATRTKDGYKAVFKINQLDNPNYRFISSDAFLPIEGHNEIRSVKLNQDVIFDIPKSLVEQLGKDNISINFRTWVQLIDNVYNHTILSPDGDKLRGAEGLNRSIKIVLEKDAEILSFIPLTDGLYNISFWTNNQNVAAATWRVIFFLIFLGIMIFIIWKSTQYKSKTDDHTI